MIRNFKRKAVLDLYDGVISKQTLKFSPDLHEKIRRLFDQIDSVTNVETLRIPPGNKLEKLKGPLKDYWSIRINNQWRIIFIWKNGDAFDVDITDYH